MNALEDLRTLTDLFPATASDLFQRVEHIPSAVTPSLTKRCWSIPNT